MMCKIRLAVVAIFSSVSVGLLLADTNNELAVYTMVVAVVFSVINLFDSHWVS